MTFIDKDGKKYEVTAEAVRVWKPAWRCYETVHNEARIKRIRKLAALEDAR